MSFNSEMEAFINRVKTSLNQIARASEGEISNRITMRTPVDTGNARAHWQSERPNECTYLFTNNVEYIGPLEYGHSQQAPTGMVRISAAEWEDIVTNAARAIS